LENSSVERVLTRGSRQGLETLVLSLEALPALGV